jgi:cholesterol oxidase
MFGRGVRLQTEQDPEHPNPTYIEAANDAAKWIAAKLEGIPQSSVFEALGPRTTGAVLARRPMDGIRVG